jgi:hypothetical protein
MSDSTQDRGAQDRSRINVGQEHELRYWSKELGVDEETLKATVQRVGPMVNDVRSALRGRSH